MKKIIALLLPLFAFFGTAIVAESPPKPPATVKGGVYAAPASVATGWTKVATINDPTAHSWKVPYELAVNGGCFVVVAFDTYGNESAPSQQICLEPIQ